MRKRNGPKIRKSTKLHDKVITAFVRVTELVLSSFLNRSKVRPIISSNVITCEEASFLLCSDMCEISDVRSHFEKCSSLI